MTQPCEPFGPTVMSLLRVPAGQTVQGFIHQREYTDKEVVFPSILNHLYDTGLPVNKAVANGASLDHVKRAIDSESCFDFTRCQCGTSQGTLVVDPGNLYPTESTLELQGLKPNLRLDQAEMHDFCESSLKIRPADMNRESGTSNLNQIRPADMNRESGSSNLNQIRPVDMNRERGSSRLKISARLKYLQQTENTSKF